MSGRPRALVLLGDAGLRRAIAKELDAAGIEPLTAGTADAAVALARTSRADAAIVDAAFLGSPELMKATRALPIVAAELVGGERLPANVTAAVPKGGESWWVSLGVERAIEASSLRLRAERAERRLSAGQDEIVTVTKPVRALVSKARRSTETQANVLVTGEPGSGKELFARVALGSADATVLDLGSTEDDDRRVARLVDGSALAPVLFVLHVEHLSRMAQEGLLVALSTRTPGQVRVVSTADASLRDRVRARSFDPRLHVALSHVLIEVPPLRTRPDDIGVLAIHFLKAAIASERAATLGHAAMRALRAYGWPHNVAELRAAMQHAAIVMGGGTVVPADLPFVAAKSVSHPLADLPYPAARAEAVGAFEREYVGELLRRTGGNITQAARLAGMDRANFRRIAKRLAEASGPRRASPAHKS